MKPLTNPEVESTDLYEEIYHKENEKTKAKRNERPQMGKEKKQQNLLTSTVGGRRGRDFACGRETGGLGDIQNHTKLSTAFESLAKANRGSFEHRLEARTAGTLWLGDGAAIGDKGQAIGHGENKG